MTDFYRYVAEAEGLSASGELLPAALYLETARRLAESDGAAERFASAPEYQTFAALADALPEPLEYYARLLDEAKRQALEVRLRAHAPFSHFLVGAALVAFDGGVTLGCNVESSSYGLTICAERTALVSAVAAGKKRFAAVVVAADTEEMTPPCGACRQMLYDFAPTALVTLVNPQGREKRFTMKELLPEAFSAAFLT